jgi:hypothetical protein
MSAPAHSHAHTHDHAHGHAHVHAPAVVRATPGHSLLRLSLGGRLAIAGGFVAAIWLGVFWAIA